MASLRLHRGLPGARGRGRTTGYQHLLDAVSVRSILRGRIRFHLGFEGDEILADTLRREVQKLESVKLDSYSVRTRNALVTFRQRKRQRH